MRLFIYLLTNTIVYVPRNGCVWVKFYSISHFGYLFISSLLKLIPIKSSKGSQNGHFAGSLFVKPYIH